MRKTWAFFEKEPEDIGSILKRWMQKFRLDIGWKQFKVFSVWEQITNEDIHRHTKPVSFHNQILDVLVDSPVYGFELRNFRKMSLLKKLQENCTEIYVKDIRFICDGKNI